MDYCTINYTKAIVRQENRLLLRSSKLHNVQLRRVELLTKFHLHPYGITHFYLPPNRLCLGTPDRWKASWPR